MSMNQSLMGTSIKDIGRNIQKLSRENKKLERYLKNIGTSTDTLLFRTTIKNEIHETTALVKSLLSSIQDLKSQENNDIKFQRLEKQFLEQYTKLSSLTKSIKNEFETTQPYDSSTNTKQSQSQSQSHNQSLINPYSTNSGAYDLSKMNDDTNLNNPFGSKNDVAMDQFENHPPIPIEENESNLSQRQQQELIPKYDAHLDELEEREEQIHQMADDLTQLNSMYKDLSGLVDEQGEVIEVLSSNVQTARDEVKSGTEHLDVAAKHQRKYRKKMCIVLMIVLLLAAVLAGIFYFTN